VHPDRIHRPEFGPESRSHEHDSLVSIGGREGLDCMELVGPGPTTRHRVELCSTEPRLLREGWGERRSERKWEVHSRHTTKARPHRLTPSY
jgi:hypothetical protein